MSLLDQLQQWRNEGVGTPQARAVGHISRTVGLTLEARGLDVPVGGRCRINPGDGTYSEVEVVGFDDGKTYLMPLFPLSGIRPGTPVIPARHFDTVPAGDGLLGRVLNGVGQPLDGAGDIGDVEQISFHPKPINPLDRMPISQPLDVGIRSINAMLSVGCGQRVGLFAGSGVGKSVLLGMMTRFTAADVIIVALVGERGREVREFVETNIGKQGMARTIVVASPADETPVMRLRAGMLASRLAEYYRDKGKHVLLLFDSLTRYAQAQREIALATGEPPATKGYPPSVFARLPQLVERAGNGASHSGSVTAFYTVLTEGDDMMDPVADAARAILDGHVVLSRAMADEGIYPAVDIQSSISRSMPMVVEPSHMDAANQVKQLYSRYEQSRDLINVGAYTRGVDQLTDRAIDKQPAIRRFLAQGLNQAVQFQSSFENLLDILVDEDAVEVEGPAVDTGNAVQTIDSPAVNVPPQGTGVIQRDVAAVAKQPITGQGNTVEAPGA